MLDHSPERIGLVNPFIRMVVNAHAAVAIACYALFAILLALTSRAEILGLFALIGASVLIYLLQTRLFRRRV